MFLSGHACACLVSRFMSFVPSRSTLNTLSDFVPSRSDSFFCATCASLQILQQILVAAFMGSGQWEWLYKLCSHIGFFRCLSSLSCCHFPLLGALARRIQDQSSAYICLKPDKCGSKLHAERFKSVSVAIPFGTWKPNTLCTRCPGTRTQNPWISIWISEHLVAAQGRPAHQQRSPQGRSEVHLTMQRPWHTTWNLWKHESQCDVMRRHSTHVLTVLAVLAFSSRRSIAWTVSMSDDLGIKWGTEWTQCEHGSNWNSARNAFGSCGLPRLHLALKACYARLY